MMNRLIPLLVALIGCGDSKPRAPIPVHQVVVDGKNYEVRLRCWCDSTPCELLPDQDVHWEISPDGRVKVMRMHEEVRFERGLFEKRAVDEDQSWVPNIAGDYLLATDDTSRAYIIHYPLASTAGQTN
jgi:hypothetical protein